MFNEVINENYNENKDDLCGFEDIISVLDDLEKYDKYIDNKSTSSYYNNIKSYTYRSERGHH